jgi:hypothetical protein
MTLELKERVSRLVPTRCQICGSWGHSHSGTKWLCDSCLAKLFNEKRVRLPVRMKSSVQISLF